MRSSHGVSPVIGYAGTILFLHFMFFRLFGFPLTIAPFVIFYFLATNYTPRVRGDLFVFFLSICVILPLINVFQITSYFDDVVQFSRTYALWLFNATAILMALFLVPKQRRLPLERIAFLALVLLSIFVILQAGLAYVFDSTALYNIFGSHQYLGEYKVDRWVRWGLKKAPGFYLEPSFCAFVAFSLWSICQLYSYKFFLSTVIFALGLVFIGSASGFLAFFVALAVVVLRGELAVSRSLRWLMKAVLVACAISVIVLLFGYLSQRVASVTLEGSSTYYRFVAPLAVLRDVLLGYPSGVAFGQVESFLTPYGLRNGQNLGTSIDNAIYLMVFYFGWLAIVFFVAFFARLVLSVFGGDWRRSFLLVYAFLSLSFSGGILLPEYAFILVIVIYAYRMNMHRSKGEEDGIRWYDQEGCERRCG